MRRDFVLSPDCWFPAFVAKFVAEKIGRKPANIMKMAETFAFDEETSTQGKVKLAHVKRALTMRPFNAGLKTLCWKIGESFVKISGKA
jgi:hypothetical protein